MIERTYLRYEISLRCLYSMESGPEWAGTAVNLTRGGCSIIGSMRVQKDDCLQLFIFLRANRAPVEVRLATVRWPASEDFGVEFITVSPRDAQRLQAYLSAIESEFQ